MGVRRQLLSIPALLSAVLLAAGTAIAATSPAPAETERQTLSMAAEFVVFERPYVGVDNLGPIDLAELFHPGGIGGDDNLPCTPDRIAIDTNQIEFSVDPVTGEVTGTGTLVLRCQFHFGEGCEAEQRTVLVEFLAGLFDPVTLQTIGGAVIRSTDRIAQNWGNSNVADPSSCTWGTTNLGPVGPYELGWRLDLATDPATGWLAADVASGDPAQRIGFFEVGNPVDVERVVAAVGVGDAADGDSATDPPILPDAADPSGAAADRSAAVTSTVVAAPFGVFGPEVGGDESSNALWLAFAMIFVFLAAVFLFGRRFLRRSAHARPGRR